MTPVISCDGRNAKTCQVDTTKESAVAGPENPVDDSVEKTEGEHQQEQAGEPTEPTEPTDNQGDDEDGNADEEQQNVGAEAMNGGLQNMSFQQGSDEYNQMQMMMAMQNGMGANNSFGGFPMMGM